MATNLLPEFTVLSTAKSATADEKPPLIKDAIKSLKDGIYPIVRGAYLFDWKYYILESYKFRINVKETTDAELAEHVGKCFDKDISLFVMIKGMEYCIVGGQAGKARCWKQFAGDKATSWVWDAPVMEWQALPEPKSIDEIPF